MNVVVELTNKIQNTLNKLINKNDLKVETTELLNELLETLKVTENCKDKKIDGIDLDKFHKSISEIESRLAWLEKAEEEEKDFIIEQLNEELFQIDIRLNKEILCEGCKEKEIEKLTDKCGNEEIARFLYDYKLNANYYYVYIRWIPFDKFRNVEYLAKGGFGEVHKATWINGYYVVPKKKYEGQVVLKRIYNSSDDKTEDILKEVK